MNFFYKKSHKFAKSYLHNSTFFVSLVSVLSLIEKEKKMDKTTFLVLEQDEKNGKELEKILSKEESFVVDKIFTDADKALDYLKYNKVDVVLTEIVLKGTDGLTFVENLKKMNIDSNTKVVVETHLSGDGFVQRAFNIGVDYYIIKPYDSNVIIQRIKDLLSDGESSKKDLMRKDNNIQPTPHSVSSIKNKQLELKITNIFITVGIPAHIKGYQFLREAIKMAIENPEIINSITKKLYPSIAERFETSASKVERAIRHAIEVAWNRGKIENINNLFGIKVYGNNEKPTNGEFIALVADKMLIEGA